MAIQHAPKTLLNALESPAESAKFPGQRAHRLEGDLSGFWSVAITGHRRFVFRFEEGRALDVDLPDYHSGR